MVEQVSYIATHGQVSYASYIAGFIRFLHCRLDRRRASTGSQATERVREREREREKERERGGDRGRETETDRQRGSERGRGRGREGERDRGGGGWERATSTLPPDLSMRCRSDSTSARGGGGVWGGVTPRSRAMNSEYHTMNTIQGGRFERRRISTEGGREEGGSQ